jgi:hypothetical protein
MAYLDETFFECARQQSAGGPIVANRVRQVRDVQPEEVKR